MHFFHFNGIIFFTVYNFVFIQIHGASNCKGVSNLPNIKSAKKRVLVNQTKLAQNKAARSALKTAVKKFDSAVQAGDAAAAQEVYRQTVKTVDQAASNGIIPKNRASHIKSKMTLKLNKISA